MSGCRSYLTSRLINTGYTFYEVSQHACCSPAGSGGIDEMVLLDREIDMVTPMCTQLTYEGLIDETLQIKNGSVMMDGTSGRH